MPQVPKFCLLGKTEVRFTGVRLIDADLGEVAAAIAEELGLRGDQVRVTDVRDTLLVIDVLPPTVDADRVVGRANDLMVRLSQVRGVKLLPGADVHSDGVLGLLAVPQTEIAQVLEGSQRLAEQVRNAVRKRALVFATGGEVRDGAVRDANTPLVMRELGAMGYRVVRGPVLPDDPVLIARAVTQGAEEGFGLVVLTGGIGAEDKDCTVEAVRNACDRVYIEDVLHFQTGTGRHVRSAVSIAAGELGDTLVVTLPGPTAEVEALLPVLCSCLAEQCGPADTARKLARRLAGMWERAVRCGHAGREGGASECV